MIYKDVIKLGQCVFIIDDLFVIGGIIEVIIKFVEEFGGIVVGIVFLIEFFYFDGRKKFEDYDILILMKY